MAQKFKLTQPFFDNLQLRMPGEVVEIGDNDTPGRSWLPFGPGPHRVWQPPVINPSCGSNNLESLMPMTRIGR